MKRNLPLASVTLRSVGTLVAVAGLVADEGPSDDERARSDWLTTRPGAGYASLDELRHAVDTGWESLTIACERFGSCTGFEHHGVTFVRREDGLDVVRWHDRKGEPESRVYPQLVGDAREEIEAQVIAHCQAAIDSVHPVEVVGPPPEGNEESIRAWRKAFIDAGGELGFGGGGMGDFQSVVVRVERSGGSLIFTNPYDSGGGALCIWVESFGPARTPKVVDTAAFPELEAFKPEMKAMGFEVSMVTVRPDRVEGAFRRENRVITVVKRADKWWLAEPENVLRPLGLFRMFGSAEEFKPALLQFAGSY